MGKFKNSIINQTAEWIQENGLCEFGGGTISKLSEYLGIDRKTFYRWMKEKPEFAERIEEAKDTFRQNIARDVFTSLAKAAKGYEYEQTKREDTTVKGQIVRTTITTTTVHVEPNVTAAIFLLKNLDPEHFKDVQRQEITGRDGEPVETFTGFNFLPYTEEADKLLDKE